MLIRFAKRVKAKISKEIKIAKANFKSIYLRSATKKYKQKERQTAQYFKGKAIGNNKRLAVLAHFDCNNTIADYFIYLVKSLNAAGCDVYVVSTCKDMSESEVKKVLPWCKGLVLRDNCGYDFGSYAYGIEENDLSAYEQVIICNDSVYGPLYDIGTLLDKIQSLQNVDMCGLTDGYDFSYHLQSYFIVFQSKLIHEGFLEKFFSDVVYFLDKTSVIINYEVGLTKSILSAGYKVSCIFPVSKLACEGWYKGYYSMNVTHQLWDKLIVDYQFPFIKRELLKVNPLNIGLTYGYVKYLIENKTKYDVSLIQEI